MRKSILDLILTFLGRVDLIINFLIYISGFASSLVTMIVYFYYHIIEWNKFIFYDLNLKFFLVLENMLVVLKSFFSALFFYLAYDVEQSINLIFLKLQHFLFYTLNNIIFWIYLCWEMDENGIKILIIAFFSFYINNKNMFIKEKKGIVGFLYTI